MRVAAASSIRPSSSIPISTAVRSSSRHAEVLQGLAGADDAGAYLAGTNPKHEQFVRLRDKYLAVTAKGKIPAGPDLTPGMKDPQVALLRQRLGVRVEAIGNNEGDAEHYDPGSKPPSSPSRKAGS